MNFNEAIELLKIVMPAILVFVAAFLTFRNSLKKDFKSDKIKIQHLRQFVKIYSELFYEGTKNQIDDFKKVLEDFESNGFKKVELYIDSRFNPILMKSITISEVYTVFIGVNKAPNPEVVKIFNDFTSILYTSEAIIMNVMKLCEHYSKESDISRQEYQIAEENFQEVYNALSMDIKNVKDTEKLTFVKKFEELFQQAVENKHYEYKLILFENFYKPLLEEVVKLKLRDFITLLLKIEKIYLRLKWLKKQSTDTLGTYMKQLEESLPKQEKIISFLKFKIYQDKVE